MQVFVCTDHKGHYPVGTASVVIAENERQAYRLLETGLQQVGLADEAFTLKQVDITTPKAIVLCDGNY